MHAVAAKRFALCLGNRCTRPGDMGHERFTPYSTMPYRWSDEYGARVGVMPRGGTSADVRWVEVTPCYVFHPLNAYEDERGAIVMDVVR